MPLPSTPPISSNDIQAEFGGSAPFVITDYYRGGGLVPNTSANSGVPTSGSISILDFLGASSVIPVVLTPVILNRSAQQTGSVNLECIYSVQTSGTVTTFSGTSQTPSGTLPEVWLPSGESAGDYSVRFVLLDRTPSTTVVEGTGTTYQALTTTRSVSVSAGPATGNPGLIQYEAVVRADFRKGSTDVGSVQVTLQAHTFA